MGHLRTNLVFTAIATAAVLVSMGVLFGYLSTAPSANTLRLGFFPNVTHAQALLGIETGYYQQAFGSEFSIQPRAFNAGPMAIQGLLANQVDLIFVGPSPTLNGLAAAGPDMLRVIAGAASGGASFVIQPDLDLVKNSDFANRTFASPQRGNTQDIALRHFLWMRGQTTKDEGGSVDIITTIGNAGILTQFQQHRIDGAWVPEPWATRLVLEGHGKVLVDERSLWPKGEFVTTQLVTTKRYLDGHHDILTKFLNAYVNVTLRLQRADAADLAIINGAITNLTGTPLPQETVTEAFMNLNITYDPISSSLAKYLEWAQDLGFIAKGVNTNPLYDLTLLNEILTARGLPQVTGL